VRDSEQGADWPVFFNREQGPLLTGDIEEGAM
jgi:hypothetical protein